MELPNEVFFCLLATIAMITVKMSLAYFDSPSKSYNLLVQTIIEKMDSKR